MINVNENFIKKIITYKYEVMKARRGMTKIYLTGISILSNATV
jgi:hypothetical protein